MIAGCDLVFGGAFAALYAFTLITAALFFFFGLPSLLVVRKMVRRQEMTMMERLLDIYCRKYLGFIASTTWLPGRW